MTADAQQQLKPGAGHGNKTARWVLAGILLLGAALRFAALGQESLWADEYHSLLNATQHDCRAVCLSAWNQGVQAPYFLILHAFIRVAGQSDLALRLPSAIFGVLALGVMYLLARALFSGKAAPALLAAGLLAVSPMHVWYSQEARPYALQVLVELLALLALVRGLKDRKDSQGVFRPGPPRLSPVWLCTAALLAILALEIHHFSIFIWATFFCVLTFFAWRQKMDRLAAAPGLLILMVGAIHPLLGIADRLGPRRDLQSFLPPSYSPFVILDVLRAQFLGPHWSPLPFSLQCLGIALGFIFLISGASRLVRSRLENPHPPAILITGWLLTLVAPTLISLVHPIIFYGQRYLIIALPFTILILAANLANDDRHSLLSRRTIVLMSAGASCLFLVLQLIYFFPYYAYRQKHLWDQVGALLDRQYQPEDHIYVIPARNAGLLARYMQPGTLIQGLPTAPPDLAHSFQEQSNGRIFLVSYENMQRLVPWLAQNGIRSTFRAGLFETHQPGQVLWINEYVTKGPHP